MTRSNVQLGGQELKLDADADTTITADTDDQIDFKVGGTDRLSIGSTSTFVDDVSISGSSPTLALADTDVSNNKVEFSYDELLTIDIDPNNARGSTGLLIKGDGNSHVKLDDSGNVIIGSTTSPTGASDCLVVSATNWDAVNDTSDTNVVGILISPSGRLFSQIDGNATGIEVLLANNIHSSGATCSLIQYRTLNSEEGSLTGNSSGLTINNVSDYRKKERVTDLTDSIDVIKTLKPRQYYYRKEFGKPTRAYAGFIAHEVQDSLLPHMTNGVKDGVVTKESKANGEHHDMEVGDPVYQTVAYGDNELITRLVGAVQELSAKVETLEAEVAKLKG